MAITFNTDRLDGLSGTTVNGLYARIPTVYCKQYDTGGGADGTEAYFGLSYDVIIHNSAVNRNAAGEYQSGWHNKARSREIDRFTVAITLDQMNAANANIFTLAYADLKAKLAAGGSPIATSIADA